MSDEILDRFRAGACSAEVALMELLLATEDLAAVRDAVADEPALAALLEANAAGCARIVAMVRSGVDEGGAPAASVDAGIAAARRLFDWSVQQDEASSVALYSLGNPAILDRATAEIVALLERWGLLAADARVLDLGCGIGRLLGPLAARVARVVGVDVSPRMVEVAARRAAAEPRIEVRLSDGRGLDGIADASLQLVVAVDSFPYIVQVGAPLVARMLAEIHRVLVPGGHLALFNYSYGGEEPDLAAAGFELLVDGERPFALWDGRAWLSRRPAPRDSARSSAPRR